MSDPQSTDPGAGAVPDPGKAPEGLVGSVLAGRYRLLRLLGSGAMGAVYVGEHLKIGRHDAIKVLRASLARDAEAVARFTRGARNASAIRHPNVCTVYDFSDTSDGLQFLAMEFVDGESLTDLLEREGPLPLERAVRMTVQAASALEAAHEKGIVHRDLKPDNIMVTRDRDGADLVKVVDFDIAKGSAEGEARGVTRLGFVVGTPEYMSPEQLTGDPLDGRSDVFSLGLVFFRMITGTLPYQSASTQDLMVDRLTKDALKLRDVAPDISFPAPLQSVMDHALARNRDERCDNARAFAVELWGAAFGVADGAIPSPDPSTSLPGTVVVPGGATPAKEALSEREKRNRRRWIQGGAGVALGAAVITVIATMLSSGPPEPTGVMLPPGLSLAPGDSTSVQATGASALDLERRTLSFRVSADGRGATPESVGITGTGPAGGSLAARIMYPPQGPEGWLAAELDDSTPPTTLVIRPGRTPDAAGRYDATVVVGWEGGGAQDTLRVTLAVESRTTPTPPSQPIRVSPEEANTRAWNQLFLLTDDDSRSARLAVKDTTQALWDATYLADTIRARAAYAHAQAAIELSQMTEGLEWARRASMLVPGDETYRDYLRQLQGGGDGL